MHDVPGLVAKKDKDDDPCQCPCDGHSSQIGFVSFGS